MNIESHSFQYMGCIGVKESMRQLCPATRSEVAKESINRLCIANNIFRGNDKKRPESISSMLEDKPNLLYSGVDAQLHITNTHINVVVRETQQIIVQHEMRNVSFASSGDEDAADFVAYVAKNSTFGRACFVLVCGHETAKVVLESIARGFAIRTQQLYNSETLDKGAHRLANIGLQAHRFSNLNSTVHLSDSRDTSLEAAKCNNNENQVDESVIAMTRSALEKEPWFHGSYLSREESETRLKQDGDFLVRESMLDPGHFVLSVMHQGNKLHLLFDSMGQVRTREMLFEDISHLVKYHHDEHSPIVAENQIVYLRNGVRPSARP